MAGTALWAVLPATWTCRSCGATVLVGEWVADRAERIERQAPHRLAYRIDLLDLGGLTRRLAGMGRRPDDPGWHTGFLDFCAHQPGVVLEEWWHLNKDQAADAGVGAPAVQRAALGPHVVTMNGIFVSSAVSNGVAVRLHMRQQLNKNCPMGWGTAAAGGRRLE